MFNVNKIIFLSLRKELFLLLGENLLRFIFLELNIHLIFEIIEWVIDIIFIFDPVKYRIYFINYTISFFRFIWRIWANCTRELSAFLEDFRWRLDAFLLAMIKHCNNLISHVTWWDRLLPWTYCAVYFFIIKIDFVISYKFIYKIKVLLTFLLESF